MFFKLASGAVEKFHSPATPYMIEEFIDEYHTPYRKKIVQKLHLTVFYVSICPYQLSMFSNKCLLAFVSAFPLHKEYWNKCLTK